LPYVGKNWDWSSNYNSSVGMLLGAREYNINVFYDVCNDVVDCSAYVF